MSGLPLNSNVGIKSQTNTFVLVTRRSQDRIQPTVPINQEIMAHRAIGNELNILLLSGSYVYFAVFCLQLVGDPDVPAEIRTDKGRGV